jgi:hypothetical protein
MEGIPDDVDIEMVVWDMDGTLGQGGFAHGGSTRGYDRDAKSPREKYGAGKLCRFWIKGDHSMDQLDTEYLAKLPSIAAYARQDFFDLDGFKFIVECLIGRGIKVGIASMGSYCIIKSIMNGVFGLEDNPFDETNIISGSQSPLLVEAYQQPEFKEMLRQHPGDKSVQKVNMIKYMATKLGVPLSRVMFFDDTPTLVRGAHDAGINAYLISRPGFTMDYWRSVVTDNDMLKQCSQ